MIKTMAKSVGNACRVLFWSTDIDFLARETKPHPDYTLVNIAVANAEFAVSTSIQIFPGHCSWQRVIDHSWGWKWSKRN